MIEELITTLNYDLNDIFNTTIRFSFTEEVNAVLVNRIEQKLLHLTHCLANGHSPRYEISLPNGKKRVIDFDKTASRDKFSTITYLLANILKLAKLNKTCTKRELYYENLDQFCNQNELDRALIDVAQILNTPVWQLRILGTAKGVIAGNLIYELDGQKLSIDEMGSVIPRSVMHMRVLSSTAKWIILVEKDTVFQRLLQEGALKRLGPCLLMTGKGFPDVNTRMLVRRLWDELQIPVLCLMDADPHGIEIMCSYRFGSAAMAGHSDGLACTAVRWLGVHPSDITRLRVDHHPLSIYDKAKLQALLSRPYILQNSRLLHEVNVLLESGVKAEVEDLCRFASSYLTDGYILHKLRCKEYI